MLDVLPFENIPMTPGSVPFWQQLPVLEPKDQGEVICEFGLRDTYATQLLEWNQEQARIVAEEW